MGDRSASGHLIPAAYAVRDVDLIVDSGLGAEGDVLDAAAGLDVALRGRETPRAYPPSETFA